MADPSKSELLEMARQAVSAEDYAHADEYYTAAIRYMEPSDPDYAECLECLVSLKQACGDFQAALDYSLRLIKLGEGMLGPDHALVAAWKKQVAQIHAQLGRKSESKNYPVQPAETEINLVPNPKPLPRPFQTPPAAQSNTGSNQISTGSFVRNAEELPADRSPGIRRSTEVKKPARPSARSLQNMSAMNSDANAATSQSRSGKKSLNDAQVYVSVDNENDDADVKEQQSSHQNSSAARKIQFSDQDMLEREQMHALEVRERNDNILRMVLVSLTTGILVAAVYYCWTLYGIAEQSANFTKAHPSADNVRYLRILSNKTIQLGLGERSEKCQYSTFSISLEDFFRSLASAVLSKEFFLQDHGDYITDEDGTSYFNDGCAQQLTVQNMHKVAENCRIYYHRKASYPLRIVDPDASIQSGESGVEHSGTKSGTKPDTKSGARSGAQSSSDASSSNADTNSSSSDTSVSSSDTSGSSSDTSSSSSDTSGSSAGASSSSSDTSSSDSDTSSSGGDTSQTSNTAGQASTEQPGEHEQSVDGADGTAERASTTGSAGLTNSKDQTDLLTVENPYTRERELPVYLHAMIEVPANLDSESAIKQVLEGLRAGGKFPEEPALKPGGVSACQYVISGNGHKDSLLVVHGADENGKLIAGSGIKKTFLYVQKNGTEFDTADKSSPFGRSFMGVGPRIDLRPNFLCMIECRPEFPVPLWILRYRFILPAIVGSALFFVMGKISSDKINRRLAYGMAALSVVAALLSILNSVCP